ncbi:MAG: wax ester/triacylglycerol synthase family O-acyltransferase [Desulfobacterales bacterium]|nr:wax ester/triacylglycerol synthase family O-acyltransferase [Desulfobacterales bacterium]
MTQIMSKIDNFWFHMDQPTNLMIISGVLYFDEPLDFERVRKILEKRFLIFDRFRKKVVKPITGVGLPVWEDDKNFDIRSHLCRIALPSPGDKSALQLMVSDLLSQPLDESKPLWKIWVIDNYGSGSALFTRIHHCIADGIALIHVLLSLTDTEPDANFSDEPTHPKKKIKKTKPQSLSFSQYTQQIQKKLNDIKSEGNTWIANIKEQIPNLNEAIEQAMKLIRIGLETSATLTKHIISPSDTDSSFKGEVKVRKCAAWSYPIPVTMIKTIGQSVNGTVNDVLIGVVTGALRRYLQSKNDPLCDRELKVAIPVNVRKPGKEFKLGNNFSLIYLQLPVNIEDPVMRLKEVKRRMDHLKESSDVMAAYAGLSLLGLIPERLAKHSAHFLANKATAVLTNVPGPRQAIYFAGKQVCNMMFWVPTTGSVGLGISIISYNGEVTLGIASDEHLVPDPQALLDFFKQEFDEFWTLVQTGKIVQEPLVINDRFQELKAKVRAQKEDELFPPFDDSEHSIRDTIQDGIAEEINSDKAA